MKRRLVIEMDAGDRADSVMQEIFTVLMKYADYNDPESVKAAFSDRTCAVILETVQGEGGIYPATK